MKNLSEYTQQPFRNMGRIQEITVGHLGFEFAVNDWVIAADPFQRALPCWQDHKEMDECADRLMRRAIAQEWIAEADYFEVLAIADAIERLDRRKLSAPFYADVSIAEALQYQSFMGLRAVAMDAGNSIHVQRRGCEVLELLTVI